MPPHALAVSEQGIWFDGHASTTSSQCSQVVTMDEKPSSAATSSSSSPKPLLSRRSVRFQGSVTVHEIPSLSEITDDEVSAMWYDDEEYAAIKARIQETVARASKDLPITERLGYCMRGLEAKTEFGSRRRKNNKAAALNTVWNTQVELWDRNVDPEEGIAQAYRIHSIKSKFPAMEAALNDQMYVIEHVR